MAIHRLRLWLCQVLGRDRSTAAFGFALLLLAVVFTIRSWEQGGGRAGLRLVKVPDFGSLDPPLVDLTLLRDAKVKGAFCLDGSPPGYHLQRGEGSGSYKWLLHLEGGGWCNDVDSCGSRKRTALGSSMYMEATHFVGILSPYPSQNPDFFNWNRVKVRYCDGGSLAGNTEIDDQSGVQLFFKGQRIWEAIVDQLLSEGLAKAKQDALPVDLLPSYIVTIFGTVCQRMLESNALQMPASSLMKRISPVKMPYDISMKKLLMFRMSQKVCQMIALEGRSHPSASFLVSSSKE